MPVLLQDDPWERGPGESHMFSGAVLVVNEVRRVAGWLPLLCEAAFRFSCLGICNPRDISSGSSASKKRNVLREVGLITQPLRGIACQRVARESLHRWISELWFVVVSF
jgi:hypothetical protein